MTVGPVPDLNQTIVSAVNARIEAEVAKALSGDETIGRLVTAALMQPVRTGDFSSRATPFLTTVLSTAIRDATKHAVAKLLTEEMSSIEEAVRIALRRDLDQIASTLAHSLADAADKTYGVEVKLDLKIPMR